MIASQSAPLSIDGKFFRAGESRVMLKMVTYGPFPDPQPDHLHELGQIAEAGFNAIRIYTAPSAQLLDAALQYGLWLFVGCEWASHLDFISDISLFHAAQVSFCEGLREWGDHPAVAGVFVANEIPADMVRWMGAVRVRGALEDLISFGREISPHLLYAYASFPTTEYLEPNNADFTAINVYLERREDFAVYLPRLHHVAGDRPVLISEFGLDTQSHGEAEQEQAMLWCLEECASTGIAGVTFYAWSDRWLNAGEVVDGWSFGIKRRDGSLKPVFSALSGVLPTIVKPEDGLWLESWPKFSVVVCTHNGEKLIGACLSALMRMDYPDYEVIVVNDGSSDQTEKEVAKFPHVRLINLEHAGLSSARNRGAVEATGDIIAYTDDDCEPDVSWLRWLAYSFVKKGWDACGGPNLPPLPLNDDDNGIDEAVVASAPGAPSHVMLTDIQAEHIPGCNLVVRKDVFDHLGGFDPIFRVAGDDVDFCWRLRAECFQIGFSGGAFVWHRRRSTLCRYFQQQIGYGKAEALLMKKHPLKFKRGCGASWKGRIYTGAVMTVDEGSVIYHGAMGIAPYQQLSLTMQPLRPLVRDYDVLEARLKLRLAQKLQPILRRWARWRYSLPWRQNIPRAVVDESSVEISKKVQAHECIESRWWGEQVLERDSLLASMQLNGWEPIENDGGWDMLRDELRLLIAYEYHRLGAVVLMRLEVDGGVPDDIVQHMARHGLRRLS